MSVSSTGVSVGVLRPDVRPVLVEAICPRGHAVRDVALGLVGDAGLVTLKCECGACFTIHATARELDS